jgi:hypothetical protein
MEEPLPMDCPALHCTNDPIISVNHIQDLEFFIGTHGYFPRLVSRNLLAVRPQNVETFESQR